MSQSLSLGINSNIDAATATLPGDDYIHSLASYIKSNSERLSSLEAIKDRSWSSTFLLSSSTLKPITLTLSLYHLYYILLKIQEAGFADIGDLDVPLENVASQNRRPAAVAQAKADAAQKDRSDAVSTKTGWSYLTTGAGSIAASWWSGGGAGSSGSAAAKDPLKDLKMIYTAFTLLPSLRLVMSEDAPGSVGGTSSSNSSRESSSAKSGSNRSSKRRTKEITGFPFAEYPGDRMVPMRAFKSLQRLELQGLDARVLLFTQEWVNIKVIQVRDAGMEEVGDLLFDPSHTNRNGMQGGAVEENLVPRREWSSTMRILDLQDNDITNLDLSEVMGLEMLHSLSLRKNLLNSVPTALGNLSSLRSLDLSANMIDSVMGIYKSLGNLAVLNLRTNRISSLCGLERLLSLQVLDLRNNLVYDVSELTRLAVLPHLRELYISHGNPFLEELAYETSTAANNSPTSLPVSPTTSNVSNQWRIDLFNDFLREGHMNKEELLSVDGYPPTWAEKRSLTTEAYRGAGTSGFAAIQADRIRRGGGHSASSSNFGFSRPESMMSTSTSTNTLYQKQYYTSQQQQYEGPEPKMVFISPKARRQRNTSTSSVATMKSTATNRRPNKVHTTKQDAPPVPVIPRDYGLANGNNEHAPDPGRTSPSAGDDIDSTREAGNLGSDDQANGNMKASTSLTTVATPTSKPKIVKRKHRRVVDLDNTSPHPPKGGSGNSLDTSNVVTPTATTGPATLSAAKKRHERSVSTPGLAGLKTIEEGGSLNSNATSQQQQHHTISSPSTSSKAKNRSSRKLESDTFAPLSSASPPKPSGQPRAVSPAGQTDSGSNSNTEVEEFRKKIEKLRDEVGVENWLSVYASQGQQQQHGASQSKGR